MNFTIEEIKKAGFTGFKKIGELCEDSTMIPKSKGVYIILNPDNTSPEFLTIGTGGHFKGKNPNVSIDELKSNWVDKTIVVYIGKATSLQSRLKQYWGFGQGKNIGHYGGRLIWQLKKSKDLIVCWKEVINDDPRTIESKLIVDFKAKFANRPFANLKD